MKYSIDKAKEELKNGIRAYMQKDENGNYLCHVLHRIPFYLEGKPGIGKTDIVRQTAQELGIGFVSYSITHHTRNSLLGLPIIQESNGNKWTEYTMSEIMQETYRLESEEGIKEGILLLDEFNCASETIMPAMLAFLQSRNIGKYSLPEGWFIVLCGNPPKYNRNAKRFDSVILDRVRRMEVDYSVNDFLVYAKEKKLHPIIQKYLLLYKGNLYRYEMNGETTEIVTCRGWENLSIALQSYEMLGQKITPELVYQYIKSEEIVTSFFDYYTVCNGELPIKDVYEILQGKNTDRHMENIEKKGAEFHLKLVDIFGHIIIDCLREGEKETVVSKRLENGMKFLAELPEGAFLTAMMYRTITESKDILKMMVHVKNDEFLKLCRNEYGIAKSA